jgi:hypothetical protein
MLDGVYLDLVKSHSVIGTASSGRFLPLFESLQDNPKVIVKIVCIDVNGQRPSQIEAENI